MAGSTMDERAPAAVVAFWLIAVVFVTAVSTVVGWLPAAVAAHEPPGATAPATEPDDGPATITLPDGATVEFPVAPSPSEQVLEIAGEPTVLTLHSGTDADEATYSAGVVEYPDSVDLSDPAVNLIASVSGAAGNVGGRIASQRITTYRGAPAAEFEIEAGTVRLLARNVLQGRRLYAMSVAYSGDEPSPAAGFLDSLELPE